LWFPTRASGHAIAVFGGDPPGAYRRKFRCGKQGPAISAASLNKQPGFKPPNIKSFDPVSDVLHFHDAKNQVTEALRAF